MRLIDIPEWSKFFHEKLDAILPESIHDRGYRHAMQDVDAWIAEHTIEAEPVRHGRWELHGNDDDCGCSYFCSECHNSYDEDWFYTHGEYTPFKRCPNCGAKMDAMTFEEASRYLGKLAAKTLAKLKAEEAGE